MQHMSHADVDASTHPRQHRGPRRSRAVWILVTFVAVLLLLSVAGAAVTLMRHRSGDQKAGTPVPTVSAGPASSPTSPERAGAANPSAGTSPDGAAGPLVSAQCEYPRTSEPPAGQQGATTPDARPKLSARSHAVLTTNYGVVEVDLAAEAAPCTVNSFLTLARRGFFAGTQCHRLTTDGLYVLQCGDPSGTGQGGPGYQFGDENLPTASKPAYPRGTLAMANAGPGTNGSQFFLVYKDSGIDPNYTVFGKITAGLDVLDQIAVTGTDDANGPGDGRPKREVTISQVG